MAKNGATGHDLDEQPALDRLLEDRIPTRELRDELNIKFDPGHGGDFEHFSRRLVQAVGLQENGIAHSLRNGHMLADREVGPGLTVLQPTARDERSRELLDEERHPLGPVVERSDQRWTRHPAKDARRERCRSLPIERLDGDLAETTGAPEAGSGPPERMPARDLVVPVGADDEHRLVLDPDSERRQELQRRTVGPLEVVEDHRRRLLPGDRGECGADCLEYGRAIALLSGRSEFRK